MPQGIYKEIPAGETVLLIFRKYKLFLTLSISMSLAAIVVIFIGLFFVPSDIVGFTVAKSVAALVAGALILMIMISMMIQYLVWSLNMGVVTIKHVYDIDQFGIFGHKVTALPLEKIEDVSVDVAGAFQHMMGIGNIVVQSAGEATNVEYHNVQHPEQIAQKILAIQDQILRGANPDNPMNTQQIQNPPEDPLQPPPDSPVPPANPIETPSMPPLPTPPPNPIETPHDQVK